MNAADLAAAVAAYEERKRRDVVLAEAADVFNLQAMRPEVCAEARQFGQMLAAAIVQAEREGAPIPSGKMALRLLALFGVDAHWLAFAKADIYRTATRRALMN